MAGIIIILALVGAALIAGIFLSRSVKAAGGCACGCNSPRKEQAHQHEHGEQCCQK